MYKKNFPHATMRPAQIETLEDYESFFKTEKKYFVRQIPTGGGKSPIVAAIAITHFDEGSMITTCNQQLQQQYINDVAIQKLINLVPLYGKSTTCQFGASNPEHCKDCVRDGVMVDIDIHLPTPILNEKTGEYIEVLETERNACPYYKAIERIQSFKGLGITNFHSFIYQSYYYYPNVRTLVIDEAHNLPHILRTMRTLTLSVKKTKKILDYVIKNIPSFDSTALIDYTKVIDEMLSKKQGTLDNLPLYVSTYLKCLPLSTDALSELAQMRTQLETFRNTIKNPSNCVLEYASKGGPKLEVKVLDISPYFRSFFSKFQKIMMVSSTFPRSLCDILGIKDNELDYKSYESSFPVENRLVVISNDLPVLRYQTEDKEFPKILRAIKNICIKYHKEKGIIHTQSHQRTNTIVEHFRLTDLSIYNRFTIVKSEMTFIEKSEILAHHKVTPGSILIGAGLEEGLDLPNDAGRFAILVKVPYPQEGLFISRLRKEYPEQYVNDILTKIVQACGRVVRHEKDFGTCYLLDGNFFNYFKKQKHLLPQWFVSALRTSPLSQGL